MASSAFWNSTLMVLLYLSSGREMTSASILLKLHGLEDGSFDPKDFEVAKPEGSEHKSPTADKRQSTTGTCTCTCETKPISNATSTSASSSSSSSSSEWTAETSAAETSARKQPHPPPEMVASSLRTDTSGRHQGASSSSSASAAGGGGASDAGKLKMRTQMEDAADDNDADEEDGEDDEDVGDSNKIIDTDITDNLQSDWGHGSRFLWKRLPDRMCYRESCLSDKDCCLWYNLCDRSAKVCVDCWYGSPCTSERDCCIRYPYCELEEDRGIGGLQQLQLKQGGKKRSSYAGQCVDQIS